MSHEEFIKQTGEGILGMCTDALLNPELDALTQEARSYYEVGVSPTFEPDGALQARVIGVSEE